MAFSSPPSDRIRFGFSLIEAAIILAIVGLVIGGIWVAARAVNENFQVNNTEQALIQLLDNGRKLFVIQSYSSGSGFLDAASLGILPQEFLVSSGALPASATGMGPVAGRHAWGGAVLVYYVTPDIATGFQANGIFSFMFDSLPQSVCIKLVTRISSTMKNGIVAIGDQGYYSNTNLTTTFPILPDTPICNNTLNNITFIFSMK